MQMNLKHSLNIKKIIRYLILILAFVPIIVDNSIIQNLTVTKNMFSYLMIFLVSILFLIGFIFHNNFRMEIACRIKKYYKNPIVISLFFFILFILISIIPASDKYHALWGDVGRLEGFIGIFTLSLIFFYSLIIFEKKDWLWFSRLSLITIIILFSKALFQFCHGVSRPDSFVGNPALLAGYFAISVFFSIYVFSNDNHKFWKYLSILALLASFVGIFLTQTRGAILGLVVGLVCIILYTIWKGKGVKLFRVSLRNLSIFLLLLIVAFSLIFVSTRHNKFWHGIPGLSRVAEISNTDTTTQTRLILYRISLNSVNPRTNLKNFTFGWGQDNFILAYLHSFDPRQFAYESKDLDRAHNKLLDVLVMNGILGLIAYISIFFFSLFYLFKEKGFSITTAGLLFAMTAYLSHLFFLFDNVDTYVSLFIMLSFIVYNYSRNINIKDESNGVTDTITVAVSILISIILGYSLFTNFIPGYIQLRNFKNLVYSDDYNSFINKTKILFSPFTFAQGEVRSGLVEFTDNVYKKKDQSMEGLVDTGFSKAEEYLFKIPQDVRFRSDIATAYANIGNLTDNADFLKKSENNWRALLSYSPQRSDYNLGLASSLYGQELYVESLDYFEKAFYYNPAYYIEYKKDVERVYINFYKYFYKQKDLDRFTRVSMRLKEGGYKNSSMIDQILDFINKNKRWPNIVFE